MHTNMLTHKDMHTHKLYAHTSQGPSLDVFDGRAQDDSSLKTFPPTTSTVGCDSGYIKSIFFPIPEKDEGTCTRNSS